MAINLSTFGEIVDCIYQGTTDVSAWHSIAEKICKWLNARSTLIFTPQHTIKTGGFSVHHNFAQEMVLWESKYHQHDIWGIKAFEKDMIQTGNVMRDQDLVSEQEFLDSMMYREFLAPANIGRVAAGIVFSAEDNAGYPVVCVCHRPFDSPFLESDLDKLKLLMPHLSRSLGVMFKLRDAEFKVANSMRALNCLSRGVLLFNSLGQVCHANDSALALLSLKDGLQLKPLDTLGSWYLKAASARIQTLLDVAISEAISPDVLSTSHFSQALNIARPSGKADFILSFSTLGEQHEFDSAHCQACAIAFIYDASKPISLNNLILKNTYGFSKTELKVVSLLVNGFTLDHTAKTFDMTVNTVKTHLKHIHVKTNTNNRAKLVKLLMNLSND